MALRVVALRGSILLALQLLGLLTFFGWEKNRAIQDRSNELEIQSDQACEKAMHIERLRELRNLFHQEGERVSFSEWPKTLGDIPGYYEGSQMLILNVNQQDLVFKKPGPKTPVEWTLWQFPGQYRWFAVATVRYRVGPPPPVESIVVMKKHGLRDKLPTK
ncbi:MAG TPA: hypothetical protein VGJ05_14670 [Fimbriiglobus sp.]|jgi:hypothetical protein